VRPFAEADAAAVRAKRSGCSRRCTFSNECINNCSYCGFFRATNQILRVTLSLDEVRREAAELKAQGFRNLLLVAGEHPKICLERLHARLHRGAATRNGRASRWRVGPMETEEYRPPRRPPARTG